jgi:hypothetical protein
LGLGHRASPLQAIAISAAATLTAKAEQAADNPATTPNDLVRLTNAAARARADMMALLHTKRDDGVIELDRYLNEREGATA